MPRELFISVFIKIFRIVYIGIYQNILVKSTPLRGCFLLLVIYNISELGWFE